MNSRERVFESEKQKVVKYNMIIIKTNLTGTHGYLRLNVLTKN